MKTARNIRTILSGLFALLVLYGSDGHADAADQVLTLKSTSGANMRVLVTGDAGISTANLILLAGDDGRVHISGSGDIKRMQGNFLVRSRRLFVKQGFLTALVDAPADRKKVPGLLGGFRATREHASDLAKVAAALTAMNAKPVVVIGTSRGAVSAANFAARQREGTLLAAILTSSLVKRSKRGASLLDVSLNTIKIPVLFVHNSLDACPYTQLADTKPIVARMNKAGVKTDLILVASKKKESTNDCRARTPHGFLGIEAKVILKIAAWIRGKL